MPSCSDTASASVATLSELFSYISTFSSTFAVIIGIVAVAVHPNDFVLILIALGIVVTVH